MERSFGPIGTENRGMKAIKTREMQRKQQAMRDCQATAVAKYKQTHVFGCYVLYEWRTFKTLAAILAESVKNYSKLQQKNCFKC